MPYKNYIGIKSLFYFCPLPLRLDSYRGCAFGCLYCFSHSLNNRNYDFFKVSDIADPTHFNRLLDRIISGKNNINTGILNDFIRKRIPFHFGTTSDPLQPIELSEGVTFELLSILDRYNYPFVLSTKSALIGEQKYYSFFLKKGTAIQISFSTLDDDLASIIEPNAPSPSNRLKLLSLLSQKGIWCIARIQPYLYPYDTNLERILLAISQTGVKSIILEHLRIPTNSKQSQRVKLWQALGMNVIDEYNSMGIKYSRVNYELKSELKMKNIRIAQDFCKSHNIQFCSGDNDFHHISDSVCCCGLDCGDKSFNLYDSNLMKGIRNGLKMKTIDFNYIYTDWQPNSSISEHINSQCRINKKHKIIDFLEKKIDTPSSSNSPASFYGIEYKHNEYHVNFDLLKDLL